jgi:site-specific DNA recombinase
MYMGKHEYGKRSANPNRKLIARTVPAIVEEQTWNKAQAVLKSNWLFGIRGAKNQYLLRGLVKCDLCNLTYIGLNALRPNGKRDFYYRCNGKHGARGLYGERGQRCPSKAINGDYLEQTIWSDVESFLRNPGSVIEQLKVRFERQDVDADRNRRALAKLERVIEQKAGERDRVVGLYRKGRIGDATMDVQMDQIQEEENALSQQIATLRGTLEGRDGSIVKLKSTEALLRELRACLDKPLSWEVKRRLVELLVEGVRINTTEKDGRSENSVAVTYRFPSVVDTCTDTGSSRPSA